MLFDLLTLGLLRVSGMQAKNFLQGQLTCDVNAITENAPTLGAHCNPQGRIISLFYLFYWQSAYYLLMPRELITIAESALKKYALFFKVELSDVSQQFHLYGCTDTWDERSKNEVLLTLPVSSSRCIIMTDAMTETHAKQVDLESAAAWKYLDFCQRLPSLYPNTSQQFLPHELHLDKLNAIAFNKGCYTGQEIIARMHYRGKLKNHLYLANIASATAPQPGQTIYALHADEINASGTVVDVCQRAERDYWVLLLTTDNHAKNQHLFLDKDALHYFEIH